MFEQLCYKAILVLKINNLKLITLAREKLTSLNLMMLGCVNDANVFASFLIMAFYWAISPLFLDTCVKDKV